MLGDASRCPHPCWAYYICICMYIHVYYVHVYYIHVYILCVCVCVCVCVCLCVCMLCAKAQPSLMHAYARAGVRGRLTEREIW